MATASDAMSRRMKTASTIGRVGASGTRNILVVNHALFFSDLALRREGASILPDYDVVIFDEAHTVEAVAGDHLGLACRAAQFRYSLNKLYNERPAKGCWSITTGGWSEADHASVVD